MNSDENVTSTGNKMEITSRLNGVLQQYQASLSVPAAKANSSNILSDVRNINRPTVNFGSAYVLNLSQAAQEVLAQQSNPTTSGLSGPLTLSEGQILKLESVLSNYQTAPLNDETSAALYEDLRAAGLLPSQLATAQEANLYDTGQQLLSLLGAESSDSGLLIGVSGLLGGTTTDGLSSSEKLVTTLLRYGEISGQSRGVLLDAQINSYLNLIERGGLVT